MRKIVQGFSFAISILLLASGFSGCGSAALTPTATTQSTAAIQTQTATTSTAMVEQTTTTVTTAATTATTTTAAATTTQTETQTQSEAADVSNEEHNANPVVSITMKNGGTIVVELDRNAAPITVDNFVKLVEEGFYDGLNFHRVIAGFMIQGGCPDGTGMGDPGYEIKGEFMSNGWDNLIKHTRGVISMARSRHPDSAGSQFFIMHADAPHLDGDYAAFGKVIEGMDVVDRIAEAKTNGDSPVEPEVIETARVEEQKS